MTIQEISLLAAAIAVFLRGDRPGPAPRRAGGGRGDGRDRPAAGVGQRALRTLFVGLAMIERWRSTAW